MSVPQSAPEYQEWGRITRFFESARLAFARERTLWESLEIAEGQQVELSAPVGQGEYRVWLHAHMAAIDDEGMLFQSVLIHSYALLEASALARLGLEPDQHGGIEDWGTKLLGTTGQPWTNVTGGLRGAVEVAVVRNAFAHGDPRIRDRDVNRLGAVEVISYAAGDEVELTYEQVREFRHRLLSLMRNGGVGS